MTKARNLSLLSAVEAGATTDQTKADIDALGINGFNKNWVINGGFDIWQRSTSAAQTNGGFVADRWKGNNYVNGTFTFSKRTDATGQTFKTYGRLAQSSAGSQGARQGIVHFIEGNYLVGKTITVSFKARANAALTGCIVRGIIANQTFNLTTSFVKHSFTATALAEGANTRLMFDFGLENTTWYVDIAEVQVEVGSVATDFEHRSYGEEFALCQRYYEQTVNLTGVSGGITLMAFNTANGVQGLHFDVRKRAAPTVVLYGRSGVANTISYITTGGVVTGCAAQTITADGCHYISVGATLSAGGGYEIHYSADAEL